MANTTTEKRQSGMKDTTAEKRYNVAVVGATGVVGQQFLRIMAKHNFPLRNLKLFASKRSAGSRITYGGQEIEVKEVGARAFAGVDLVFISATDDVSRNVAPVAVEAGAVVIDDSGVWRMEQNVPLVVPEVNADDVAEHRSAANLVQNLRLVALHSGALAGGEHDDCDFFLWSVTHGSTHSQSGNASPAVHYPARARTWNARTKTWCVTITPPGICHRSPSDGPRGVPSGDTRAAQP